MKTKSKLMYKFIMYLLLFLCAVCISFHLTIYGVQSVQEMQNSQLVSINNEYNNSGDGNTNSKIQKKIININANNKSSFPFFIVGTFSIIIFNIQICELYIYGHDYFSKIFKKSLIAQKICLNI